MCIYNNSPLQNRRKESKKKRTRASQWRSLRVSRCEFPVREKQNGVLRTNVDANTNTILSFSVGKRTGVQHVRETHVVLLCSWSIPKCMCVRVSDVARRWYTRAGHAIRTCERGCMRVPTMSTTRPRGSLIPSPPTRRDSACITSAHPYYRHPVHPLTLFPRPSHSGGGVVRYDPRSLLPSTRHVQHDAKTLMRVA